MLLSSPIQIPMNSSVLPVMVRTQMPIPIFKPMTRQLSAPTQRAAVRGKSVLPLRYSAASSGGGGSLSPLPPDSIVLHVEGMMCEGCANNVKRILESRPQVSSASVNLASEIAIVSPVSEETTALNWQQQIGETLAEHLTNCGFNSSLQD